VSFRFATVPFRPTRLGIKISGYPKRVIDLHSWELREMAIPDSFLQQLVLLVPTAALIDQRNNALSIQVVAGKQNATAKFSGYMLWLSSEKDLIIPSHVTDGGRSQLEPGQESLARFYTKAERLDEAFELHPGDSVCIAVKAEDGSLQRSQSFTVRDLMNSRDFPQVEVIDVPEPNKTYQGC
jgi:hypothetical protein